LFLGNSTLKKVKNTKQRILIQLSKKKYNEGENAIDKPTLEQVQNYIKYLKNKISDSNKVFDYLLIILFY
jgi:hypothetical protein